jgi:hypothetical protein
VDDSFSAPAVTGCGLSLYPPVIDSEIGLPSPAGHNTAIIGGSVEMAVAVEIEASE